MIKDIFSDGVLVYDRYYCSKPATALLVIKKILLAAAFCGCSMGFVLTELAFPVSVPAMAGISAAACCLFSLLFTFVKKRIAVPAILAVSGLVAWQTWESVSDKLAYFADACMLTVEGRFLYPRRFLFHRGEILDAQNLPYADGVLLGTVLLCAAYALIISACFSGRLVPVPAGLLFVALCVPPLISERLEFSLWLIPALACFAGLVAIRKNYSGGLAVIHSGTTDYRRRIMHEERSFMRHIRSAAYPKRIEMKCNFYSKYFSAGMYCAALAAVSLLVGAAIIPAGGSIDYSGAYEFITSLASDGGGSSSPFDEGAASEYFTHGGESKHDSLNIITPGRGEREIIRVQYTGDRPFYLRGDIGIDFNGTSWTTAVSSEPELWRSSGLKDKYRPCEDRVISALLSATGSEMTEIEGESVPVMTTSDVSIEYLCDTNVVFLPPYTAEYSFYNNDSFDVFADYAVRVSGSAGGHVNSVRCTALVPAYTSNESSLDGYYHIQRLLGAFDEAGCTPDDIYTSVVPEMTVPGVLSSYEDYVNSTYLSIPDDFSGEIADYIERELADKLDLSDTEDPAARYLIASEVGSYLRENYTYSLDGSNSGRNPVMQFLDDTKRGHCSLYASAMTLILRELGIPARYCTGFYVESQDGSNSVLLREKNLHAWVEVYLGEYGWATFDPTSSAAYPGRNTTAAPDGFTTETSRPSRPTMEAASRPERPLPKTEEVRPVDTAEPAETIQASGEAPAAEQGTPAAPIMAFAACGVAATAAVVALIIAVSARRQLKKRARNALEQLRTGEPTASAAGIYRLVLELLSVEGVTPGKGELPAGFFGRADEACGTSFADCTGILEKMEFGGHDVSETERDLLYSQLQALLEHEAPFKASGKPRILRIICNCTKK